MQPVSFVGNSRNFKEDLQNQKSAKSLKVVVVFAELAVLGEVVDATVGVAVAVCVAVVVVVLEVV